MGKTKIEWATDSFNPGIFGCSKDSTGCKFCYAMAMAARLERMGQAHYAGLTTPQGQWTGEVRLLPVDEAVERVLRYPKARTGRKMVFTTSMADVLHEDIPLEWAGQVVMAMTRRPEIIWQYLTKRAERLPELWAWLRAQGFARWPENVWVMVSVENQEQADRRIRYALQVPAKVIGLSVEPLLGPVDLVAAGYPWGTGKFDVQTGEYRRIGWIVFGGESGPDARLMHPAWARSLRDQAVAAGIPLLFKQWGTWAPDDGRLDAAGCDPWPHLWLARDGSHHGGMPSAGHDPVRMRKFGKRAAGRLLDGRTWDEVPS